MGVVLGEGGVRVDEVLLLEAEVKEAMEARACVGRGLRGVGERGVDAEEEEDVGRGGWAERDCWAWD